MRSLHPFLDVPILDIDAYNDETVSCGVAVVGRAQGGDAILIRVDDGGAEVRWDLPTAPSVASEPRRQAAVRVLRDAVGTALDSTRIAIAPVFPCFFDADNGLGSATRRHRFVYGIAHVDLQFQLAPTLQHRWVPAREVVRSPPDRWARSFLPTFVQAVAWRRGW